MTRGLALDPVAWWALRAALALLLVCAGLHKLRAPRAFRAALEGYALLPRRTLALAAPALVAGELGVGAALLVPALGAAPALAAGGLLAIYSGAVAINLLRGRRDIDCGCMGPAGRRPLAPGLVARNAVLLAAALAAAAPPAGRALGWLDLASVAAAVATAALLYAAADALLVSAPSLARLRGAP